MVSEILRMHFLTTFLVVFSSFGLLYQKGDSYLYHYSSSIRVSASSHDADETAIDVLFQCSALFTVLLNGPKGAYLRMTLNDTEYSIGDDDHFGLYHPKQKTDELYSKPVFFMHYTNGSVGGVYVDKDDTPEVISLKLAILTSLKTSLSSESRDDFRSVTVADHQGLYYEHYRQVDGSGVTTVSSHYTEDDFITFHDPSLSPNDLALDAMSTTEVMDGRIVSSKSIVSVMFTHDESDYLDSFDSEDEPISFSALGNSELKHKQTSRANDKSNYSFETFETFLNTQPTYKSVEEFDRNYYIYRQAETDRKRRKFDAVADPPSDGVPFECPASLDACRAFDHTWTVGNKHVGMSISLEAIAGLRKGCFKASRSFALGTQASVRVHLMGKSYSAMDYHLQSLQFDNESHSNVLGITLFGQPILEDEMKWMECNEKTHPLKTLSKPFSVSVSFPMLFARLNFTAGVELILDSSVAGKLCPKDLTGYASFLPSVKLSASGQSVLSSPLAKGGLSLVGSVTEALDPNAWIDGGSCEVGFRMFSSTSPFEMSLSGWFQTRSLIKDEDQKVHFLQWGPKHEAVILNYSTTAKRKKIIDVSYQAR